jgi:hypothetical protein
MAATESILTPQRSGEIVTLPLAAATKIFQGTLVAINAAGNAVPASDTAALRVIGRAEEEVDNSDGSAGDLKINVARGVFRYANSGTNAVDADDKGKICFVEDDQTVAETTTNKIPAGRVLDVDADGVWVDTHFACIVPQVMTALAALTSTNGTMAAAVDDAATKAEGEKIGDDVRAVHATLTDVITALKAHGFVI